MRCIVNLSTQKYWKGQDRLIRSLKDNTDAQLLMYKRESDVGAKPHSQSMYGFKPLAIEKAYNLGYRELLWLDASMYVIKDLDPIFKEIEKNGFYAQDSGWENERWTTDNALRYFGTNKGRMISSGVLGVNMNHSKGIQFLEKWTTAMKNGLFNGSHDDFRHDQSCASLIIENMGLHITENNTHWNYGKDPMHENILILADGII